MTWRARYLRPEETPSWFSGEVPTRIRRCPECRGVLAWHVVQWALESRRLKHGGKG